MPFFSRHSEGVEEPRPEPGPARVEEEKPRRHGLFGSLRRDASPTPSGATQATHHTHHTSSTSHSSMEGYNNVNGAGAGTGAGTGTSSGGIFNRSSDGGSHRGLLHRSFGNGSGNDSEIDPSIMQARERVMSAEAAERDADRALDAARQSVREAHEHVRKLEVEAQEEARLARIKQHHAREVSKRGKQLGRHGI